MLDIINSIILGIIEGITEWLPVSSTGHIILAEIFFPLRGASDEFKEMFDVVMQLGAVLAVLVLFWRKLWPFSLNKNEHYVKIKIWRVWFKILVAILPSVIVAIPLDDWINDKFYNWQTIATTLIVYGILFIVVETFHKSRRTTNIKQKQKPITYKTALIIGLFQALAIIPGTSRSGATILGALLLGISRPLAAEFTFFLAIPTMFGASLLKSFKFIMSGTAISGLEIGMLAAGSITAFVVSLFAIAFLMNYVKKHDFKIFGWYRIVLGIVVILYFTFIRT